MSVERIVAAEENAKSAHKRLDTLSEAISVIHDLGKNVAHNTTAVSFLTEKIDKYIGGQKGQGERLGSLEAAKNRHSMILEGLQGNITDMKADIAAIKGKPGKYWGFVVEKIILLVVGGGAVALLGLIGS